MDKAYMKSLLDSVLAESKKLGIEDAAAILEGRDTDEVTFYMGSPQFGRYFESQKLTIYGYGENKSAIASAFDLSKEGISAALRELSDKLKEAKSNPFDRPAPPILRKEFSYGPPEGDMAGFKGRISELFDYIASVDKGGDIASQIYGDFSFNRAMYLSSFGGYFCDERGYYSLHGRLAAKKDGVSTNANPFSLSFYDLDVPFIERYNIKLIIDSVLPQLGQGPLRDKFVGDIVLSPLSMTYVARYIGGYLSDKRGFYKDALEKEIMSPLVSVHVLPAGGFLPVSRSFTTDGKEARDQTAVKNGVLKSYIEKDKGAQENAFGAATAGAPYVFDGPGTPLSSIIENVGRGILIGRLAATYPSSDGSVSGVSKQAFLIEEGKIKRAVIGSMASSNLLDMMKNVRALSKEQVNFGHAVLPYMQIGGVTISG